MRPEATSLLRRGRRRAQDGDSFGFAGGRGAPGDLVSLTRAPFSLRGSPSAAHIGVAHSARAAARMQAQRRYASPAEPTLPRDHMHPPAARSSASTLPLSAAAAASLASAASGGARAVRARVAAAWALRRRAFRGAECADSAASLVPCAAAGRRGRRSTWHARSWRDRTGRGQRGGRAGARLGCRRRRRRAASAAGAGAGTAWARVARQAADVVAHRGAAPARRRAGGPARCGTGAPTAWRVRRERRCGCIAPPDAPPWPRRRRRARAASRPARLAALAWGGCLPRACMPARRRGRP